MKEREVEYIEEIRKVVNSSGKNGRLSMCYVFTLLSILDKLEAENKRLREGLSKIKVFTPDTNPQMSRGISKERMHMIGQIAVITKIAALLGEGEEG